jgi:large subunit ribosomal protein L30
MSKVRVTQVKSSIDRSKRQKATLEALGLRKISQSSEHDLSPQIEGMIRKVEHLVKVEEI